MYIRRVCVPFPTQVLGTPVLSLSQSRRPPPEQGPTPTPTTPLSSPDSPQTPARSCLSCELPYLSSYLDSPSLVQLNHKVNDPIGVPVARRLLSLTRGSEHEHAQITTLSTIWRSKVPVLPCKRSKSENMCFSIQFDTRRVKR